MRFDDSLATVLSADMSTPFGAQSAWRQLVDLIGRGRVPADARNIDTLSALRADVPPPVRAASARALAVATPPTALAKLFIDDELAIAAPVLRVATLTEPEWIELLPRLSPPARSILRHRRDLSSAVNRALDSFGPQDFRLPAAAATDAPGLDEPRPDETQSIAAASVAIEPEIAAEAIPGISASPFVSVGTVALGMPVVAEALRLADAESVPVATPPTESVQSDGAFQIADLVARIDAYQRLRDGTPNASSPRELDETQPALFDFEPVQSPAFRFETDAAGVVSWVEGATRAPLIGMSLDLSAKAQGSRVDGVAGGAFRRRAGFRDARLIVDGTSDAAGQWRITGIPAFDRESGRFTGYRGTARRPRADECAEPLGARGVPTADALRQLVHELRTPTNAIAGFAEMIETQLLGPVSQVYRDQASTIRSQAADLLTAIDDIDMAARIESHALDLRAAAVPIEPLLVRVATDLDPLAMLRGTDVTIDPGPSGLCIAGDDLAVERLIGRLMATLVSSGAAGELIHVVVALQDTQAVLTFDRPKALAAYDNQAILTIDAEDASGADGAPLLGTGFALRLARNLAAELGGSMAIDAHSLTLRLPAAVIAAVEQATSN